MKKQLLTKSDFTTIFYFAQTAIFLYYLFLNIGLMGDAGEGEYLAYTFIALGLIYIFIRVLLRGIRFKIHLIIFVFFLSWLSLRYLIDYGGTYEWKQATLGTTGGILLFYTLGVILHEIDRDIEIYRRSIFVIFGVMYFIFSWNMLAQFASKLRLDVLLLEDLDGGYQRPGNFMSISFIILSYVYIRSCAVHLKSSSSVFLSMAAILYTACAIVMLFGSQMLGSNSATGLIVAIMIITLSFPIIYFAGDVNEVYFSKTSRIELIKYLIVRGVTRLFIFLPVLALLFYALILSLGVDVSKMNIFGFGDMELSSVNSRWNILMKWGLEQLSYAPLFGSANVAYLVTGDAGITLHNFLPNIFATFGLIGFLIIGLMFLFILVTLYRNSTNVVDSRSLPGLQRSLLGIYSIGVLFFLFAFANLTTGHSWSVIWFGIGFLVSSISSE